MMTLHVGALSAHLTELMMMVPNVSVHESFVLSVSNEREDDQQEAVVEWPTLGGDVSDPIQSDESKRECQQLGSL